MHRFTLLLVFASALGVSCAGSVDYSVSGDGYAPDLVYVAPGVQVIADYDEPIFFADSFYWRYDGSTWYRSSQYRGGWVHASPPEHVRGIERPGQYAHYRPHGWVAKRGPAQSQHQAPPRHETQPQHQAQPQRQAPPRHETQPQHKAQPQHQAPPPKGHGHDEHHE